MVIVVTTQRRGQITLTKVLVTEKTSSWILNRDGLAVSHSPNSSLHISLPVIIVRYVIDYVLEPVFGEKEFHPGLLSVG